MKKFLGRAAHVLRVIIHDPQVDRAGKTLAGVLIIRGLLAVGASAALVQLVAGLLQGFGVH